MNTEDFATLPLTAVPPGARLTAAALGADGQVLLTAGSILTTEMLEELARQGVVAVAVEPQRDEAVLNAARAAQRRRLMYLFRRCHLEGDSGAAQMLFKVVLEHRLEALR